MSTAHTANPNMLFVAVPWSAPAWMKTTNSMTGGTLDEGDEALMAQYLLLDARLS